ncbi:hypothetical protein [Butyrivibrio sp. INlla16]|uniref:hypothetical protein n=1 Tax=Butyrivibrio sp. INlla16 TaxID=1520807 RepID=UPI000881D039|nr:hypothetical protein [Butyrivibrio sp. INlla16]SDB49274.1 hypothetical protein SAMN02910263_02453 [Butyrivibrio sp. INlla16]
MNSKNEEYLDNLLHSLTNNSGSGIAKTKTNQHHSDDADLNEAIGYSSENDDLNEIGQMLEKLDGGELLDSGMTEVLDAISAPADETLHKYKVGDEVPEGYEKDADELALDEAIARAEALAEEIPELDEVPAETDEVPEIDEVSGLEEPATAGDIPILEDIPAVEEIPSSEEMPLDDIDKMMAEMGMMTEVEEPAVEEAVPTEEIPVLEEIPNVEEAVSTEEIPVQEEIPSVEEPILTEEIPSLEEVPSVEETAPSQDMSAEDIEKLMVEMEKAEEAEQAAAQSSEEDVSSEDIEEMMAEMDMSAEIEVPAEMDMSAEIEVPAEIDAPSEIEMPSEMDISADIELPAEGLAEAEPADIAETAPSQEETIGSVDDLMGEVAMEIPEDSADALLEVAPEIPIADEFLEEESEITDAKQSTEDILDEMMHSTPEEVLGSSAENTTEDNNLEELEIPAVESEDAISEEMLDIEGMLDGNSEVSSDSGEGEASLDDMMADLSEDAASLEAIVNEGGEESLLEESELTLDDINIPEGEMMTEPSDEMTDADLSLDSDMADEGDDASDVISMEENELAESMEPTEDGAIAEEISLDDIGEPEGSTEDTAAMDEISLDDVGEPGEAAGEPAGEPAAMDEISLDDIGQSGEATEESEAAMEDAEALEDISLEDMDISEEAASETSEIDEAALEDAVADFADAMSKSEEGDAEADDSDVNFESMSAELDDLLKDVGDETAEDEDIGADMDLDSMLEDLGGDQAAEGSEPADVEMPDLDAIMNSLASDDVEDMENTAHIDEKEGGGADEISLDDMGSDEALSDGGMDAGEEVNPDDILESMGEEAFDEIGFSDDIPDPDEVNDNGGDYDEIALRMGGEEPAEGEESEKKKKKRPPLIFLIFAALFKVITQTDEDLNPKSEEDELASLTDENQQVLDELAAEDGKKPKKEKKKKEKKPKKEKPPKEKKPKKEKPPKPKKEKKPKPDDGAPEKALAPKKVAISMLFAFSIGLLCCLPAILLPGRIIMSRANKAFEKADYATAYKLLYGKKLNEEQTLKYHKARVIAGANYYFDSYERFKAMNMEDEALDILLIGMKKKHEIETEAEEFQVAGEVQSVYANIESALTSVYGLSAQDIEELNAIEGKKDYTKRIMEITGSIEKIMPKSE